MIYSYTTTEENTEIDYNHEIDQFAKTEKLKIDTKINDPESNKLRWEKRKLFDLVKNQLKSGDVLIAYEAANLACSTLQLLEILEALTEKEVVLRLIKHDETFTPAEMADTQDFLSLVQNIEGDFVAHRTTDALAKRRAAGLPLGRPKGRKNKSRKLDKFRPEIKKYLSLNISKASIAKLLGCHPQTLYNYLEEENMLDENDNLRDDA